MREIIDAGVLELQGVVKELYGADDPIAKDPVILRRILKAAHGDVSAALDTILEDATATVAPLAAPTLAVPPHSNAPGKRPVAPAAPEVIDLRSPDPPTVGASDPRLERRLAREESKSVTDARHAQQAAASKAEAEKKKATRKASAAAAKKAVEEYAAQKAGEEAAARKAEAAAAAAAAAAKAEAEKKAREEMATRRAAAEEYAVRKAAAAATRKAAEKAAEEAAAAAAARKAEAAQKAEAARSAQKKALHAVGKVIFVSVLIIAVIYLLMLALVALCNLIRANVKPIMSALVAGGVACRAWVWRQRMLAAAATRKAAEAAQWAAERAAEQVAEAARKATQKAAEEATEEAAARKAKAAKTIADAALEKARADAVAVADAAARENAALKTELDALRRARRSILDVPATWGESAASAARATQRTRLPASSMERREVVEAFMQTLRPGASRIYQANIGRVEVLGVERIQNAALWKGYQVKRQSVLERESARALPDSRFEKTWLFHGTDEQTAPKIIEQGFNRSFCGKNATRLGKGVYFALEASYSASKTYSTPNSAGVQHIFLCRVVVGEYCVGREGGVAPDERRFFLQSEHLRYDSTVDRLDHPGIFVTYHDSQAYPEYLVTFRQA